jgi:cytochrome c oxidase subunit 2
MGAGITSRLRGVLLAALLPLGCNAAPAGTDAASAPADLAEPFDFAAARHIPVSAKQWAFTPATIDVQLGEHVVLDLTSLDRSHGFNLFDFGIDVTINPGSETLVPLVANKAGVFNFHCDVYCGSGHEGMAGTLNVHP